MPSSDKATAGHPLSDALRQILRNNDDYIFIKDPDLVYLGCSESFARMTGRASAKELVGKTDFDLFPRDIAEKYRSDDRQVLDTGTPITCVVERLPDRDGHKCWAKTQKHVVFDPQGQPIALYGISRDITHLMGLETEAALSRKYTDLVRNMPGGTGIFHVENDAFVLDFINDGWAQAHHLSGTKAQALVGGSVMPLIYGPDRNRLLNEYHRTERQDGSVGALTYRIYGDDGKPHWISVQFRFAYFEAPNRYYYGSYTDMDEQKKAEEKLLDSQHALRETVANSDIQFFTYFPACHRAEIYFVNNRPAEMPTEWNDFPDSFLTFTQASDADKQAYRDMIAAIDGGDAHEQRLVLRPGSPHPGDDFERKTHPVVQRAAEFIAAPVADRRQETVQQIAMRHVQLKIVEAGVPRPPRGFWCPSRGRRRRRGKGPRARRGAARRRPFQPRASGRPCVAARHRHAAAGAADPARGRPRA